MRTTTGLLILATLLVGGCGRSPLAQPANTNAKPTQGTHVSESVGIDQARAIVQAKYTEAGTMVVSIQVIETETPLIYEFTCTYRRAEFGQLCMYEAKGLVDVDTAKITAKRKIGNCLGADGR